MSERKPPIHGVVTTIAAKCRRCYHCVRSCPAKAIRVQSGQAQVIEERCIGCGNCIRVCAQKAKEVQSAVPVVKELLEGDAPVVAILAPSYPAAFDDLSAGQLVAAIRALGFARVLEVGFGAEMVAQAYARSLKRPPNHPMISTPCPALVSYVEKYMPDVVPFLAPIVSPMIALSRAVKQRYLPGAKVVFIGPCIAKKAELRDPEVAGATDVALTFPGLATLLADGEINASALDPQAADEPLPHFGALFPVPGGLLKAAAVQADLMDDSIVVVEGPDRCIAALNDIQDGTFSGRFLDALLCEGCIGGPEFSSDLSPLARRARVTEHVRALRARSRDPRRALREVADVDVSRQFRPQRIALTMPTEAEIRDVLARTNKLTVEQELNCGACGYATCREKAIAVHQGLAEVDMCLPYLIDQLQVNVERLSRSKEEIEKARELALRAQQLASMGRLAADIAQGISSPLTNIVVRAQLLRDTMRGEDSRREDIAEIVAEGLHCREILSGLEGFGRQRESQWEDTSLSEILDHALAEMATKLASAGVRVNKRVAPGLPAIIADPDQLAQVVTICLTNSLEAFDGAGEIEIEARLSEDTEGVELVIADNGPGIDPAIQPRLFQPFVTTKRDQRGAGLGLATAHGIIQAHGGDIAIESAPGGGTRVTIRLVRSVQAVSARAAIKVLIVDDDPDFLEQHRIMLTAMGFDVVTAERTDMALEVADREIPDAFILDLMIERTDSGARLSRALRRDPRFLKAPILMLTSVVQDVGFEFHRNPEEVLKWMKADAWFDKPPPAAEVAHTIRRLLGRPDEDAADVSPPAGQAGGAI